MHWIRKKNVLMPFVSRLILTICFVILCTTVLMCIMYSILLWQGCGHMQLQYVLYIFNFFLSKIYQKPLLISYFHYKNVLSYTVSQLPSFLCDGTYYSTSKVGGERLQSGEQHLPIRAYVDDMTTITTTALCTRGMLEKRNSNWQWARMKVKPQKKKKQALQ